LKNGGRGEEEIVIADIARDQKTKTLTTKITKKPKEVKTKLSVSASSVQSSKRGKI
jgi:hypothetical protein